ncbi:hypothetical protein [Streptomyces sp. NPDC087525]|uniref:hypothetical protein n=1 Tax=Streptomyces sp. NPDC087525 TaxID=3365793 RepID=UPI0038050233
MATAGTAVAIAGSLVGMSAGSASAADVARCDTGKHEVREKQGDAKITLVAYGCAFENHNTDGGPYTVHVGDLEAKEFKYRQLPGNRHGWFPVRNERIKNATVKCTGVSFPNGISHFTGCGRVNQ